jgi:hypothetical protein
MEVHVDSLGPWNLRPAVHININLRPAVHININQAFTVFAHPQHILSAGENTNDAC